MVSILIGIIVLFVLCFIVEVKFLEPARVGGMRRSILLALSDEDSSPREFLLQYSEHTIQKLRIRDSQGKLNQRSPDDHQVAWRALCSLEKEDLLDYRDIDWSSHYFIWRTGAGNYHPAQMVILNEKGHETAAQLRVRG